MKLKLEITDKEKHILSRILAVVLIIGNGFIMLFSTYELDKIIPGYLKSITELGLISILILTCRAVYKNYR